MANDNGMVFRGGLPFAPDVKRLEEAFPVDSLTEGRVIEHGRLEQLIQSKRGTGRYYGVINSWIGRLEKENGIHLAWIQGQGVKVLDPAEHFRFTETGFRQKLGQAGRSAKKLTLVDRSRLDDIGQRRLDHHLRIASEIKHHTDEARRQLAVELAPVRSLPKRKISA